MDMSTTRDECERLTPLLIHKGPLMHELDRLPPDYWFTKGLCVSAASPICSDFQTFCPDWLHFGHFICFGGIAASQLSRRIFPIYF